ncbi:hypothetical protein MCAP1_001710 [Malassezia caprae]|uniref:Small ribosomal subunit protein uS7 domain-containing protein n=2 Tax=Malassezia TaxID=55193 RepID=A0AAF0IZY1_9BASI|nr:hypothetical protein MCAP1_001710 [Malassezia caprae]
MSSVRVMGALGHLSVICRVIPQRIPASTLRFPGFELGRASFSTTQCWRNEAIKNVSEEPKKEATASSETSSVKDATPLLNIALPNQISTAPVKAGSVSTYMYSADALPPRQDPLLHFLVNLLMRDGKKASAERYIADMLGHMAKLTNSDPLPLVYEAVELAKPILRMQSRKQGGKTMQVPIPLNARQSTRRALVWIIDASNRRSDRSISRRLAVEMLAILEGNSSVLSRKEEQHKVGMINRANASIRI